jgi:hypothetical protein
MNDRVRELLVVTAVLVVIGMSLTLALRPGHDWGGDFSLYIHHAVNLADGVPYADTGYLFNPSHPNVGPPAYPPGFPLLLVPLVATWGASLTAMKLMMLLSWVAFVAMVYLSFREELPLGFLVALMAVIGLNYYAIPDVNSIGSDMPFMAMLYLTLFLLRLAYQTPREQPPRWGLMALAAAVMYCAYVTRTLGIMLVPSVLAYDLIRYRRITRWSVLMGGALFALVLAKGFFLHSDTGYLDEYRNVGWGVFAENAYNYATRLVAYWHNGYIKPVAAGLFAVMALFAVIGYVSSVRRRITLFEIFPVLYLMAVLAFPGYQGIRYLAPVMPFFVLFAFRGLQHRFLKERPQLRRVALTALAFVIIGSYISAFTSLKLDIREGIAKPESVALFDYVRHHTDEDDVMVFVKPRVMALLADRPSTTFHTPDDDRELWQYFGRVDATHLICVVNDRAFDNSEDPQRLAWFRSFVDRHRGRLDCVFENADFRIYEIADGAR